MNTFDEFYDESVAEASNQELLDLVRLHMGQLHANNLTDWLKDAFEAGRSADKTPGR